MEKVVLVLVDGMRPDGIEACGNPFLLTLAGEGMSCLCGRTVMPAVTLPCHTSLFYSVDPERHGITTNIWRPMVRPFDSLGDVVAKSGKRAAMFYNWEELRDLNRPGSLVYSHYQTEDLPLEQGMESEVKLTAAAMTYLQKEQPDFLFLYLGYTDVAGHNYGWMAPQYLQALGNASNCIRQLKGALPEGYSLVVTADHGGHGRDHGIDVPEDMTIPMIYWGNSFSAGKTVQDSSIKDIAPTIAALLGLIPPREWEGRNLLVEQV